MTGDWVVDKRIDTPYVPTEQHRDEAIEIGIGRLLRLPTDRRGPLTFSIQDPLVLFAAREYFGSVLSTILMRQMAGATTAQVQDASLDRLMAFYLVNALDTPASLDKFFRFSSGSSHTWRNLYGQLAALHEGQNVVRASKTNAVHTVLLRSTSDRSETMSWFEGREGIPVLRPDNEMNPDILTLIEFTDGSHLWVAMRIKLYRSRFSLKDLLKDAASLNPDNWWTEKVSKAFCNTEAAEFDTHSGRVN
jgi:hypothetical protein